MRPQIRLSFFLSYLKFLDFENAQAGEIRYHVAPGSSVPIPVYCAEPKPFDAQTALKNTVMCPVRYLSKAPPTMVTDNYCFIIDGDIVDFEEINREAADWWRDTSTATRYYCSDSLKTFHQVWINFCCDPYRGSCKIFWIQGGTEP
jgi:hypothetical protein